MALVWDFARQLDPAATPGNTTLYYDTRCQSFYIDDGTIRTQAGTLINGMWSALDRDAELIISDPGYGVLDIEHQYNGAVGGVAQHDADFVFLIYSYMLDVSDIFSEGAYEMQPDNPIKAGRVTLMNAQNDLFEDSAYSIFMPGNKITMALRVGDLELYEMFTFFIEQSPFAMPSNEFQFSGRNRIGFFFSAQCFDETYSFSGTFTEIFTAIMTLAGLNVIDYMIETTASTASFVFKPEDTLLAGIVSALEVCDWYIDDLPNGKIVIGSASYIQANVASTGIYNFSRGSEVFTHSIDRSIDGVFSRVCVQRAGPTPRYVYLPVDYYDGWHLAAHRTFYQTVPDTATNEQMDAIAAQLALRLQYSGIIETFDSPIRPWIQIGDVARLLDLGPRYAGIISDIVHQLGKSGFYTSFTVTSGGVITDPESENPATEFVGKMGGANRKRRLLDYLKSGRSSEAGTSSVGAVTYQAAVAGGYEGTEQQLNENLALIADGAVIPANGVSGAVLMKTTADNYDVQWKAANVDKYDQVGTQFDTDATYQATGEATVWEDHRVPLNAVKTAGTKQPGWEAWLNGLYLYWFDDSTEEEVWFAVQMPHAWAGTDIIPHVHWTPKTTADGDPANQNVEWGLEYTWINVGGDFAASSTIYGKTSIPNDANIVANRHYKTNLTAISPATSQDGLSSMLVCRLFRNATDATDDTYEDDVGLLEFDLHYEVDMLGSRTVSTK